METKSTSVKLTLKITSFIVRLLLNAVFYIVVVFLIINVSKSAYEFTYQLYGPGTVDEAPGREIVFAIKKGDSTMDIASKLELNHAVEDKYSFYVKTKLQELVVMPGTYVINSSMTYDEILDIITDYSKSIENEEDTKDAGSETGTDAGADTGTDAGADTTTE
jgi:UPF0755 protein